MNARQLAERYQVDERTVRRWSRLSSFPKQVLRGRWRTIDFDQAWKKLKDAGGPEAAEQAAAAGGVKKLAGVGRPGPLQEEPPATIDSTTATTPGELLALGEKELAKAKKREEIIRERIANQERRRRLILRSAVEEVIFARAQLLLNAHRKMALELPRSSSGSIVRRWRSGSIRPSRRSWFSVRASESQ